MEKLFRFIIRHPWTTILSILLLTVLLASQLPKMHLETDVDAYMPDEHPAIIYERKIDDIFSYHESMAIAIFNEGPDGVFNPQTLAKIKRLTEQIAQVPQVMSQRDDEVKSISTMDNIVGTPEGIEVIPIMEEVPQTREEIERMKESLYGNDMFVGWLVSEDKTAAVILAKIEYEQEGLVQAYEEIKRIVERERGGGDRIYIAGQPVLEATFVEYIIKSLKTMLPIVIAVISVLLFLTFGSLRGVVIPIVVVSASVVCCFGVMAMLGFPGYDLITMMPVILMAVGSAYGIHILNRYYEEVAADPGREKADIVLETMLTIWQPVLMSSLTSAVGFSSLLTSTLIPIRSFGVFTGLGILFALLFSLTFIPASLMLVKLPAVRAAAGGGTSAGSLMQRYSGAALGFVGRGVHTYRIHVCVFGVMLLLASLLGLLKLRANDSWVEMFPHDSEVYTSTKLINERLNGTVSLNVVIEGDEPDAIKSPSILRKMDGMQQAAEELDFVGGSISIADYIKRMNKVMNEDKEEFNTIPDTREAIAQYLLLYSLSGDPDDFDEVVDYDYRQANIAIVLKDDHTAPIKDLADMLRRYVDEHFSDEPVKVNLTGYAYVTHVVIDLAVTGMLSSIALSIVFIYLMTAIMFRSPTGGVYNIIPITIAMLVNFGLMGAFGMTVGFANSSAFAVAMGIGVDYAIHLVFKFQREASVNDDLSEVTVATLTTSGKAILFNAVVVTAGFMVLLASGFTGHKVMGRLLALSMVTSFLASITLLPAALSLFKPAFIFRGAKAPTKD